MQVTTKTSSTSTPALPPDALPQAYVGRLFERLAGQLGPKMMDIYVGMNHELVQYEWATGLAGFSKEELKRGLASCQHRKFAPNLGEFAHLCRPSLDPEIAWDEAVAGLAARSRGEAWVWPHPAVWRAAAAMSHEIRTSVYRLCRIRWDYRLRTEFAAGWGDGVPEPVKLIANNASTSRASPSFLQKLKTLGFRVGGGS